MNDGKLIIGGWHLGNPKDITLRVRELIDSVDIILPEWEEWWRFMCEEAGLKINNEVIQYNPTMKNYEEIEDNVCEMIKNGKTALMLSSEGMPLVFDQGYQLLKKLNDLKLKITVAPGPSIVTTALSVSAIPIFKFSFEGDIPEFSKERIKVFSEANNLKRTLVFVATRNFEKERFLNGIVNKNFLYETLIDASNVFGDERKMCLCFNITKNDERIITDTIKNLIKWIKNNNTEGMLTIVIDYSL